MFVLCPMTVYVTPTVVWPVCVVDAVCAGSSSFQCVWHALQSPDSKHVSSIGTLLRFVLSSRVRNQFESVSSLFATVMDAAVCHVCALLAVVWSVATLLPMLLLHCWGLVAAGQFSCAHPAEDAQL